MMGLSIVVGPLNIHLLSLLRDLEESLKNICVQFYINVYNYI